MAQRLGLSSIVQCKQEGQDQDELPVAMIQFFVYCCLKVRIIIQYFNFDFLSQYYSPLIYSSKQSLPQLSIMHIFIQVKQYLMNIIYGIIYSDLILLQMSSIIIFVQFILFSNNQYSMNPNQQGMNKDQKGLFNFSNESQAGDQSKRGNLFGATPKIFSGSANIPNTPSPFGPINEQKKSSSALLTNTFGSSGLFFNKPAQQQQSKSGSSSNNPASNPFNNSSNNQLSSLFTNNNQQNVSPQPNNPANKTEEKKSENVFAKKDGAIFSMSPQKKNELFASPASNIFGGNNKGFTFTQNKNLKPDAQGNKPLPIFGGNNTPSTPMFKNSTPNAEGIKSEQKKELPKNSFFMNNNKKQQQSSSSHSASLPVVNATNQEKKTSQLFPSSENPQNESNQAQTPQFPKFSFAPDPRLKGTSNIFESKPADLKISGLFGKKEQKKQQQKIEKIQQQKIEKKSQQKKQQKSIIPPPLQGLKTGMFIFNKKEEQNNVVPPPTPTMNNPQKDQAQQIKTIPKSQNFPSFMPKPLGQNTQLIFGKSQPNKPSEQNQKKIDLFNNKNIKQSNESNEKSKPLISVEQTTQPQFQPQVQTELQAEPEQKKKQSADVIEEIQQKKDLFSNKSLSKPPLPLKLGEIKKPFMTQILQKPQSTDKTFEIPERKRAGNMDQSIAVQKQKNFKVQKMPEPPAQRKPIAQQYYRLKQLLGESFKNQQEQHLQRVQNTFRKYLSIDKNIKNTSYEEVKFSQTAGTNKFMNDFTKLIGKFLQFPQSSYKAFGQLFLVMLKQLGYSDKIFQAEGLRPQFFNQVYQRIQQNQFSFKWERDVCITLTWQFIKFYSTCVANCLRKLQTNLKIWKKTTIFQFFLEVSLLINIRQPLLQNEKVFQVLRANDTRQILHLNKILYMGLKQFSSMNIQIISFKKIIESIPLVDELPFCPSTKLYQKFLLGAFNYKNLKDPKNRDIAKQVQKTKSKIFMPFRTIINRIDSSKQQINPYIKDLFSQIDGPQWSDWLSLYLGEDNIRLKQKQTHYFINALKTMQTNNINKILSSQIKRLIHIMGQQQQIKNFYDALSNIIYDKDSIEAVQNQFFSKNNKLFEDLRFLANEIKRFPNCEISQDDSPQIKGESNYLLTTLILYPNKALHYQNALFDMMGFIDDYGERCDRVCHLVLDILGYYTIVQFNQEIISKSFEVIISLLENNETKQCMSLALNVNIPQFDFFNRHLPKIVIEKIEFFITHLISSKDFLNSTRIQGSNIALSKAYPFRYSIQRYLKLVEGIQYTIPLNWLSNCLKMTARQGYNPQFLEIIVSKLRIYASKQAVRQSPFVLSSIVEACNSSNFFKQMHKILLAQLYFPQNKCGVYNVALEENNDGATLLKVFSSLKLLKTLIELRKIRNQAQKDSPRHYVAQLLSSLNCLNQLDRHYFYGTSQFEITSTKITPSVVSLFALTLEQSALINSSDSIKTQWLFASGININLQNLRKIHQTMAKEIDYSVLRDPLVHPYYPNLQCYENVSSLAFDCLCQIFTEEKEVSLEKLIYLMVSKNKSSINEQDIFSLKAQLARTFTKNLENGSVKICRSAWNLLTIMRSTPQNKKISQEIFKIYYEKHRKSFDTFHKIKSLVQFLREEIKDGNFIYFDLIEEVLSFMSTVKSQSIMDLIQTYGQKSMYIESVNQFDRLVHEKKMLDAYQFYQIICLMTEIVLHQVYNQTKPSTLQEHSSLLVTTIAKSDIISIYYLKDRRQTQVVDQKCDLKSPRLFGVDILEMFISNPNRTRQYLIDIQINNVLTWFNQKIKSMNEKIRNFLSVILSIDQTYYANHPIQLKTKIKSQMFCQLHLGNIGYQAIGLCGKNYRQSIKNMLLIIDSLLQKIKNLILKINHSEVSQQIIKTYHLVDLSVNWLRSCKKIQKGQLNSCCKKIITACFSKLGNSVGDVFTAKLLLTCVNILKNQLNQDLMTNLKQTIMKTLRSDEVNRNLKQQLLSLFLIALPDPQDTHILEKVANMWCTEQYDEHFYNESRVIYKLCSLHPIEMAKLKILTKCERIARYQDSNLQGVRYFNYQNEVIRTVQTKCWIWIIKIVTALMENGDQSTLVVNEVSRFVNLNKKRISFILNEFRERNSKNKSKNVRILITLAQLDELEATLELFVVLAQSKMWVEMNRELFEQFFFYLMHRTVAVFASDNTEQKFVKEQNSFNEKLMMKLHLRDDIKEVSQEYGTDSLIIDEQNMINYRHRDVFRFLMSCRFNDCLKLWLLACSTGLRNSCFVREYFYKPIKGTNLRYISTHWEHMFKAIFKIIEDLFIRARYWNSWQKKDTFINLVNDCLSSAQFFTETGYLYSIIKFVSNEDELISEIGETFSLAFQMGACHLVNQIYYHNKNKEFSKQSMQGAQKKLFKYSIKAQEVVEKYYKNTLDSELNPVFEHIRSSRQLLTQIKI